VWRDLLDAAFVFDNWAGDPDFGEGAPPPPTPEAAPVEAYAEETYEPEAAMEGAEEFVSARDLLADEGIPSPMEQSVGTGNWSREDIDAFARGGVREPVVPPDPDEQRRYVPDQVIERALLDHGFKPEVAAQYAQSPVLWESGVDYAGVARPGVTGMSDLLATSQEGFDGVLAHEFVHKADAERGFNPSKEEVFFHGMGANNPAFTDALQRLTDRAERPHEFHGYTYDINDRAHLTTGIAEGLRYDLTQVPEGLREKYFSEFAPGPAPVAQRAMLVNDEYERDAAHRIANREDIGSRMDRIPWWMDVNGPVDVAEQGPPPVLGPYDKVGDENFYDEDGYLTEWGRAQMGMR
jgi:hypothetical protein